MNISFSQQPSWTMLITGATGFIGSRLATLASTQGYLVRTLTRSDWDTIPAVPVGHRYFGNLPAQIPVECLQGVDIVVHCAARAEGGERASYAVNVEGTSRLAQMARRAGVQTFVFLSSQSARPDALSAYGRTKYAAEQHLLGMDGLNVIILRAGLVTGPGSRGLFQRMTKMVESLPVVPLLAGGRSIVQPIHVDDLCKAIFRCCEMADKLNRTILNLGDIEGVSLAEFLQVIAMAHQGHRKAMLSIPLWPIEILVQLAERLHIALPINSNNLQGLKIVEKMETRTDMARLGLNLRPLDKAVQIDAALDGKAFSLRERAVRTLLIGAGRVGLVHAVTLSRLDGVKLCGIVDPKAKATDLLKGMGFSVPAYQSLDEAISQTRPDAAVIATPVATHLPLTRACLAHGLAVLVEKPLAIRKEQLAEYEQLTREFTEDPVQVGYVMPRNPQIAYCLEQLKAGRFGKVQGFLGLTLLSLIQKTATNRWEVKKDISGGGVLINAGGHVLSMIRTAFGDPQVIEAQSTHLFSSEVEDSMVIKFVYPQFSGMQYCSWSINGYPRQENKLVIWTDQGHLILTGSVGVFVPYRGEADTTHQLDFDVGFNLAPDYAGGGFTTELADLKKAAITRQPAPMNMKEAIQLERLLFKVYDVARDVETFTADELAAKPIAKALRKKQGNSPSQDDNQTGPKRILDLRELSVEHALAYPGNVTDASGWDGYLLNPAQAKRLSSRWPNGEELRVTVPDFLNQSRLLSTGRYIEVFKQMGLSGIVSAGLGAFPLVMSERGLTFWVAAVGLLIASLKNVPSKFSGTLLLHGYLTDFTFSLRRLDILEKMLEICRQAHPKARIGFHTSMASEALNALWMLDTPVNEVSVLTSPGALDIEATLNDMRQASGQNELKITAEVGLAPYIVHQIAFNTPHRWAFGADAILIGPGGDVSLATQRQLEVSQEWAKVFPGLSMPEGVL